MANSPRILAFAGSARANSFNKKLVRIAAAGATKAGAQVTFLDFRELPLPLFDEDLEAQGPQPNARKLKDLFLAHDGFLIACPEYNSSITPLLKNAIDWASRPAPNEAPLACFAGKVAGLVAASPGGLGGLRGLVHVRAILGNIGVLVVPEQHALAKAHEAFNDDGSLKDPKQQASVENVGARVATVLQKLKS